MMNNKHTFIGREKELSFLEKQYNRTGGSLVFIYGRRRVGKTETIKQFAKDRDALFYTCTQTDDKSQLNTFSKVLLSKNSTASKYINSFESWESAFLSIKDLTNNEKKKLILVIDEFPYMVKENKSIPSILQKLWDTTFQELNIMIILCGSSMSYIEKEILAEKNPLYGRATGIYKMKPMTFLDSIKFVPNFSTHDKIATYSILGGIPYYLNQFNDSVSLEENICSNILENGSIFYSEPDFLLKQELREPATYNTIVQAISFGNTKFNEIQQSTQIEKGKLSVYLKNLMELGIIEREFPVLSSPSSTQKSQRGIYKITDFFFRFWYSFVFPNLTLLDYGDSITVYNNIIANKLDYFISLPFENICIEYLLQQNKENLLPFNFTSIGRWWDNENEIDIIATDYNKEKVISGECKFHKSKCDKRDLKKHISKNLQGLKLKSNNTIFYYYFSYSGFTEDAVTFAKENNITLITGEDLVL